MSVRKKRRGRNSLRESFEGVSSPSGKRSWSPDPANDGGFITDIKAPGDKGLAKPVPEHLLSCPFRKRNPKRFNVRDHPKCTKGFKGLSSVKSVHLTPVPCRYYCEYHSDKQNLSIAGRT